VTTGDGPNLDAEADGASGLDAEVPQDDDDVFRRQLVRPLSSPGRQPGPGSTSRYTIFVVPDGAAGPLRQVDFSLAQLQVALTIGALVCVLAILGVVATAVAVPATHARDALLDENIALKARMQDVERKLDEVDAQLRRLRLYNTQLQELPFDGIPGFGPIDDEQASNLLWLGRLDPQEWMGTKSPRWQPGMPMEEPPGDEVAPADLTESEVRALELSQRADRILQGVAVVEPQAGELVETAEEWRWRQDTAPTLLPIHGARYTSSFGWRRGPFSHRWKFHTGIDLAAPVGTPIYAAGAGTVLRTDWSSGYGHLIVIDHGNGILSRYAHNSRVYVQPGDHVERGQQISAVGTTGRTTGPHLHFEITIDGVATDPAQFVDLP